MAWRYRFLSSAASAVSQLLGRCFAQDPGFACLGSCDSSNVVRFFSGSGPSGDVHRGRWRGTDVCVKVLSYDTCEDKASLMSDLNALFKMRHPHLVRMLSPSCGTPA